MSRERRERKYPLTGLQGSTSSVLTLSFLIEKGKIAFTYVMHRQINTYVANHVI